MHESCKMVGGTRPKKLKGQDEKAKGTRSKKAKGTRLKKLKGQDQKAKGIS